MSIGVAEEVHQVRCETETPSVVMPTCLPISLSYQIFLLMFCWTQVPQNILSIFPISQYLYLIKYFFFMFLWTQVPINILSIFSGQPASQYLYLIKYFFFMFCWTQAPINILCIFSMPCQPACHWAQYLYLITYFSSFFVIHIG